MTRLLAILVLIFSGLAPLGVAINSESECAESSCSPQSPQPVKLSCCGQPIEPTYCPMSNGPCQCGITQSQAPDRQPQAPLPKTSHPTLVTVLISSPFMADQTSNDTQPATTTGLLSPTTFNSHTQRQASLGVWRL